MISASIISDRLKVNMSVARRAMAELVPPPPSPHPLSCPPLQLLAFLFEPTNQNHELYINPFAFMR
jgi:hypothetical protein